MPELKRVTPQRDDEFRGYSLWVGTDKWAYYCSGCGQLRQPGGRTLRMMEGMNGCRTAQYCGRCIRRLLNALDDAGVYMGRRLP